MKTTLQRLLILSLILPTELARSAETLPPADRRLGDAIEAHITFLADDLLEGRGTGTPGYELAALYVASQFQQLGLKPGGASNAWFQSVPLLESRLAAEGVRCELRGEGGTHVLDYNLDYVARPQFTESMPKNCLWLSRVTLARGKRLA